MSHEQVEQLLPWDQEISLVIKEYVIAVFGW